MPMNRDPGEFVDLTEGGTYDNPELDYIDAMNMNPAGSDVLDRLIQLELVKNQMKDKKKNKNEGQTFLDAYLA